jgi:peptide/nickel transport system permease protein
MTSFIIRRVLYFIPTLIIISLVSFMILQLQPGNFVTRYKFNPRFSKEQLAQIEHRYGLDKPAWTRYLIWMEGIFTEGDFGYSFETKQPVFKMLFKGRLFWTLVVSLSTMLFSYMLAIPIGIYSSTHQYSFSDHVYTVFGFLGLSIPNFFLAMVLLWLLVAVFNVGSLGLGIGGLFDSEYIDAPWSWGRLGNFLWHLWPVVLVVGTATMAGTIRYMRAMMLDQLGQQYVQTARSKGLKDRAVIWKHTARNALNPIISSFGLSFPFLMEGSLIAAIVFSLPMVELQYWESLLRQDTYVTASGLTFFAFLLLFGNLLADLLLAWTDPRIRYD